MHAGIAIKLATEMLHAAAMLYYLLHLIRWVMHGRRDRNEHVLRISVIVNFVLTISDTELVHYDI